MPLIETSQNSLESILAAVCHLSEDTAPITLSHQDLSPHPSLALQANQSGAKLSVPIINLITAFSQCQASGEITAVGWQSGETPQMEIERPHPLA